MYYYSEPTNIIPILTNITKPSVRLSLKFFCVISSTIRLSISSFRADVPLSRGQLHAPRSSLLNESSSFDLPRTSYAPSRSDRIGASFFIADLSRSAFFLVSLQRRQRWSPLSVERVCVPWCRGGHSLLTWQLHPARRTFQYTIYTCRERSWGRAAETGVVSFYITYAFLRAYVFAWTSYATTYPIQHMWMLCVDVLNFAARRLPA